MQDLPIYISTLFILCTVFSVALFYKAAHRNVTILYILGGWLAVHGALAFTGFYTNTTGIPPRFSLTVIPPLVSILIMFVSTKGRQFIDSLDLHTITLLHVVRVPVELVLFFLFMHNVVPKAMTFEGSNFDILSGMTAPLVSYLARQSNNRKLLLAWNFACLGLLINIVITAVLAAPFGFQQIGFDHPNVALFYFPYVWLPAGIVPLVLLSHLVSIRQLLYNKNFFVVQAGFRRKTGGSKSVGSPKTQRQ